MIDNYLFKTKFYDRYDDLSILRIETLLSGIVINSVEYGLDNENPINGVYDLAKSNEIGIIDLNGYYNNPATPRVVSIKATLINDAGESVSEQYKEVRLLQYPSRESDFMINVYPLTNKVAENPEFDIKLLQKYFEDCI
jgi:hypothetical protein